MHHFSKGSLKTKFSVPVLIILLTSSTFMPPIRQTVAAGTAPVDLAFQTMSFQPEADLLNVSLGFSRKYTNVITIGSTVVDALVTVTAFSGQSGNKLDTFDQYDNSQHLSAHTKPSSNSESPATFRIDFLEGGTNNPIQVNNLALSIADVDAHEFISFAGITSYKLSSPTQLTRTTTSGTTRFHSSTTGGSNTDEKRIAEARYASAGSVKVSFGCRANASSAIGAGGKCGFTIVVGTFAWPGATTEVVVQRADYSILYNANTGTGTVPPTTTGNAALTVESGSSLSQSGNTFASWNTKADGTGTKYLPGSSVTPAENITLYAQYGQPACAVTFDESGGSSVSDSNFTTGGTVTLPAAPTRAGFTFRGWFAAASGGNALTSPYSPSTCNVELFAQWAQNFTATYEERGGTSVSDGTFSSGETVTLPAAPTRPGFTFQGWYTAPDGGTQYNATTTPPDGNLTIYAQWLPYTVTYEERGGTTVSDGTFNAGDTITLPPAPTRTGYVFEGWYTAPSGGTLYGASYHPPARDQIIYAQWTPYEVMYDTQGGSTVAGWIIGSNATITLPAAPTRPGFTFDGWFTTPTGGTAEGATYGPQTGDITFFAQWTRLPFAVIYEEHGGTVVADDSFFSGNTITLVDPPTRTGYTFDGWFTAASGGTQYSATHSPPDGDLTIHAQWTPISVATTPAPAQIVSTTTTIPATPPTSSPPTTVVATLPTTTVATVRAVSPLAVSPQPNNSTLPVIPKTGSSSGSPTFFALSLIFGGALMLLRRRPRSFTR